MVEGWITDSTPATPAPAKKMAVSESKEEKTQKLNLLILSLQSAQATRQLSAATWWTVVIPAELGKGALETTRKHAEATKGQTNHKMGSPHIQLWRTLIAKLLEMTSGNTEAEEQHKIVEAYLKEFEAAGPTLGYKFVTQARLKVVKDPENLVLFYSLSELMEPVQKFAIENSIHKLLTSIKGEIKPGTAPPSEAEKKIQQQVDALRTELGLSKKN